MAARQNYPDWLLEAAEKWRLRLIPEWRIMFEPEGPDSNFDGEASSNSNVIYRHVRIWINLDHVTLDKLEEDQRRLQLEESLVHEILHPVIAPIPEAFVPAEDQLPFLAREVMERGVNQALEQAVETLARALVALDRQMPTQLLRVRPGRRPR